MAKVDGVTVPDSKLAREVTELLRDTASSLLFNHSCRVYYFGALAGQRNGLTFDSELLYIGSMFHDMGLTAKYSSATERFEVDGANAARDFLRSHRIDQRDIDLVWAAVALHTTPGIPKHMHPVIALINAGVLMDAVGIGYDQFTEAQRASVTPFTHEVRVSRRVAPGVLRLEQAQTRNDVRHRHCRRAGGEGSKFPSS